MVWWSEVLLGRQSNIDCGTKVHCRSTKPVHKKNYAIAALAKLNLARDVWMCNRWKYKIISSRSLSSCWRLPLHRRTLARPLADEWRRRPSVPLRVFWDGKKPKMQTSNAFIINWFPCIRCWMLIAFASRCSFRQALKPTKSNQKYYELWAYKCKEGWGERWFVRSRTI